MRLLLDTHVALWWLGATETITEEARAAVEDPENDVFLSAASVWEAAVKTASGRLRLDAPLVPSAREAGMVELSVTWSHAERAASLPPVHGDLFDRMLVAQALEEGLVLVTRDPAIQQYAVPTLSA